MTATAAPPDGSTTWIPPEHLDHGKDLSEAPPAAEPGPATVPRPAPEPRQPVRALPTWARMVVSVLVSLAVGTLGFAGFVALITPLQAARTQDVLYAQFRGQLAGQQDLGRPAPFTLDGVMDVIPPGSPVAVLEIPGLGLREVVVEGTASGDMDAGLGHRRNTSLPGQFGRSEIFGRRAAYGGPFRELDKLRAGDLIRTVTAQGAFEYRVDTIRRDGDPGAARLRAGGSALTMVTADGRPFMPTSTLYVDATLVEGAAQPATSRPKSIPPYELAMRPDSGGVLALVLWLPALGLVLAGMAWARFRIGRPESLIMGVPLVLAALWNVYEALVRLLPNLL